MQRLLFQSLIDQAQRHGRATARCQCLRDAREQIKAAQAKRARRGLKLAART